MVMTMATPIPAESFATHSQVPDLDAPLIEQSGLILFALLLTPPRMFAVSEQAHNGEPKNYCGHSLLLRLATGPKRNWYSAEVLNEQTMLCCLGTSRSGPLLT
jgi:hypothetical protein